MGALGEQCSTLLLSAAAKSEGVPSSPAQLYFLALEQVRFLPHPLLHNSAQRRCRLCSGLALPSAHPDCCSWHRHSTGDCALLCCLNTANGVPKLDVQTAPGGADQNVVGALRLRGALHSAALRGALQTVMGRHDALRTHFALAADGTLEQVRPRCVPQSFTCVNLLLDSNAYTERMPASCKDGSRCVSLTIDGVKGVERCVQER